MSNPSEPEVLQGANGGIQPGRYYGRSIPYLPINGYPGKLIAVEGTDGVGRSTQIQLLREWLEVKGYGVVETGWTRSPLMQPTIELAKASNTLNKLTFVLLYGMDFWESGMDMKTGDDIYESFRSYQQKLLREYASMGDEFHFRVVDARRSVDRIQDELRKQVTAFLESTGAPVEPMLTR